jgi:hypothetical protein
MALGWLRTVRTEPLLRFASIDSTFAICGR